MRGRGRKRGGGGEGEGTGGFWTQYEPFWTQYESPSLSLALCLSIPLSAPPPLSLSLSLALCLSISLSLSMVSAAPHTGRIPLVRGPLCTVEVAVGLAGKRGGLAGAGREKVRERERGREGVRLPSSAYSAATPHVHFMRSRRPSMQLQAAVASVWRCSAACTSLLNARWRVDERMRACPKAPLGPKRRILGNSDRIGQNPPFSEK